MPSCIFWYKFVISRLSCIFTGIFRYGRSRNLTYEQNAKSGSLGLPTTAGESRKLPSFDRLASTQFGPFHHMGVPFLYYFFYRASQTRVYQWGRRPLYSGIMNAGLEKLSAAKTWKSTDWPKNLLPRITT